MNEMNDSLRSLVSGLGDPSFDKSSSLFYQHRVLSDQQLYAAYRNTWLARKIVDVPALDALRKWRNWQAEQEQITLIEKEEKRLGIKHKILQCKILARLWGGAGIFIGDGGDASQPLDPESIGKGGIKYLTVMSRRDIVAKEIDQDPVNATFGWPVGYQMTNGSSDFLDIHPSRLVLQVGNMLPDPLNALGGGANVGWGDSVLQSVFTAIQNADSTAANVASLVFEANVDVYKIADLMEHVGTAKYRNKLIERFMLANVSKSVNRALITDTEEEYERKQIAFDGLPDVIQQFLLIVSGASDIPLTRLLGQSPSGLSSTGEHDMKNYYDRITSMQTLEIEPAIHNLDECLLRSALGNRPDEVYYMWAELEQMSDKERAEIGKMNADTAAVLINTGLFMPEEMRDVVGNQFVESGFYPGLADKLKENGDTLPEFDLERRAQEASVTALENPEPAPAPITDATPRPLYVSRRVVNSDEITAHFEAQGLKVEPGMHVTLIYSKQPVDWMAMGEPWEAELTIGRGGPRMMEKFGPAYDHLVLLFASRELMWRHEQAIELGASRDFEDYQPRITINKDAAEADLKSIEPWTGPIVLGPELYEDLKD